MAGILISLDGPEGCGKTTQAGRLLRYLQGKRLPVVLTREPGGTDLGERVRELLLAPGEIDPLAELLLFLACRREHVERVIGPSLSRGDIVICDRYTDASIAYQSGGRGLDESLVRRLNTLVTGGRDPDLTLLLDIEVREGLRRARSPGAEGRGEPNKDRMEDENLVFHRRVREAYLALARKEPERIKVISGEIPPEEWEKEIRTYVDTLLAGKGLGKT